MFWQPHQREILSEAFDEAHSPRDWLEFGTLAAALAGARCGTVVALRLNAGGLSGVASACTVVTLAPLVAWVVVFKGLPN